MDRRKGRHASATSNGSRLGTGLTWAWVGVRELFVLGAVGVALPVTLLMSVQLLDTGTAMVGAPTCPPAGSTIDCIEPVPALVGAQLDTAPEQTWLLSLEPPRDNVTMSFPASVHGPSTGDQVHALFWNGDAVALLDASGEVTESLDWGPLYTVETTALRLAALWPLAVIALAWLFLWRRHRAKLVILTIVGAGAAAAGPTAYAGLLRYGYPGLIVGGLVPMGAALLLGGLTLWWMRRRRRRRMVRRTVRSYAGALVAESAD